MPSYSPPIRRVFLHLAFFCSSRVNSLYGLRQNLRNHAKQEIQELRHSPSGRLLDETIYTADCNNVRLEPFQARLDLYYIYFLEYNASKSFAMVTEGNQSSTSLTLSINESNLFGLDTAIATSLVDVYNECNDKGQPMYAVQLSLDDQQLSSGGKFYTTSVVIFNTGESHSSNF